MRTHERRDEPIRQRMTSTTNASQRPRFAFGKNWRSYLDSIDEDRILTAERSLTSMLGLKRLDGLHFLDVGSGSGLFSLAAIRLGAKVHSFDYDRDSVATTQALKERYEPESEDWTIEWGSVLDQDYLSKLGRYDVVYSWGVLHHTGKMWQAMENIATNVAQGGYLFIAIYNDQGLISEFWKRVKRLYCSGRLGRMIVIPVFFSYFALGGLLGDILRMRNPIQRYTMKSRRQRGMTVFHDWIDWLGGYPFEVATAGDVFDFWHQRGFALIRLQSNQSLGCNQFVFRRTLNAASDGVTSGHPTP